MSATSIPTTVSAPSLLAIVIRAVDPSAKRLSLVRTLERVQLSWV
jgi:hypothetical protein